MNLEKELEVALQAVRRAAVVCREVQAGISPDVLDKQDRSPVTVADFASQAIVSSCLQQAFPDDPMIAEEDALALQQPENAAVLDQILKLVQGGGVDATVESVLRWVDHPAPRPGANRFWTLDPIDGTKGFLRKEQYAISLALLIDGEIRLAVLGCPNLPVSDAGDSTSGALFSAVRGHGAELRPLDQTDAAPQPVRVSRTRSASEARLCESVESGHSAHGASARIADRLGISREPVRLDSQAKYAVVARGEADIYLRLPTRPDYREKIWDHAGGVLVVEEAGGKVTDIRGRPLDFTRGSTLAANEGVVVTNSGLYEAIIDAIQTVLPPPSGD